jgi:hypothetical protein
MAESPNLLHLQGSGARLDSSMTPLRPRLLSVTRSWSDPRGIVHEGQPPHLLLMGTRCQDSIACRRESSLSSASWCSTSSFDSRSHQTVDGVSTCFGSLATVSTVRSPTLVRHAHRALGAQDFDGILKRLVGERAVDDDLAECGDARRPCG